MKAAVTERMPSVSLVIATRNRRETLGKYCLKSLDSQTVKGFEVVICDSSNDDSVQDLCFKSKYSFEIKYLRAVKTGSASQRNQAIDASTGDLVVFVDDDSKLSEGLVDALIHQASESPNVDIFVFPVQNLYSGRSSVRPGFLRQLFHAVFYFLPMNGSGRIVSLVGANTFSEPELAVQQPQWASGCGFCCRRRLLNRYRFPVEFERYGGYALAEDLFLSYGALKRGHVLTLLRGSLVVHHNAGGGRLSGADKDAASVYNRFLVWHGLIYPEHPLSALAYAWSFLGDAIRLSAKAVKNRRWEPLIGLSRATCDIAALLFDNDRSKKVDGGLGGL